MYRGVECALRLSYVEEGTPQRLSDWALASDEAPTPRFPSGASLSSRPVQRSAEPKRERYLATTPNRPCSYTSVVNKSTIPPQMYIKGGTHAELPGAPPARRSLARPAASAGGLRTRPRHPGRPPRGSASSPQPRQAGRKRRGESHQGFFHSSTLLEKDRAIIHTYQLDPMD
jgi:hypothetical protein